MPNSEDEIYSIMFSSLKHPARRKILRMLSERSMSFSELLEELGVSSSHLTYHLESLGELVSKMEDGRYKLSSFGEASVITMKGVEEAPSIPKRHFWSFSLRWKTIFAALIIGVVLLASISTIQYAYLNQLSKEHELLQADLQKTQTENQQLLSWSSPTDKALTVLQNVTQMDMTRYEAALLSDTVEYRSDLGGVIEEIIKYSLTSNESTVDVTLRFRNSHLSRYQLSVDEGSPIYVQPQPTDALAATRGILERYKSYAGDSYLEEMSNLLSSVNATNNNQTTSNHTKLIISTSGDNVEVLLVYTENGVDFSPKSLSLSFENHVLKEIIDGWFLFSIGSTQVNISSEEAITIARDYVKNFTWTANGVEVSNFTVLEEPVSVLFHPTTRGENLALIPYWYVTLYLDKTYPDGVNQIGVGVWADTGEVAQVNTLSG
jgi:DNA-binding transcriptional ArsR family regulator